MKKEKEKRKKINRRWFPVSWNSWKFVPYLHVHDIASFDNYHGGNGVKGTDEEQKFPEYRFSIYIVSYRNWIHEWNPRVSVFSPHCSTILVLIRDKSLATRGIYMENRTRPERINGFATRTRQSGWFEREQTFRPSFWNLDK